MIFWISKLMNIVRALGIHIWEAGSSGVSNLIEAERSKIFSFHILVAVRTSWLSWSARLLERATEICNLGTSSSGCSTSFLQLTYGVSFKPSSGSAHSYTGSGKKCLVTRSLGSFTYNGGTRIPISQYTVKKKFRALSLPSFMGLLPLLTIYW
jgi:hypothetical protein